MTRSAWSHTALFLAFFTVIVGTCFGLAYQQVQTNQQHEEAYQSCLIRNANAAKAKALYESLSRDAQSVKYAQDFAVAAAGIQFPPCHK